jgi:transposase
LQAPQLTPYPGPRSVVVLDNCAIHHDEEIRRIIVEECGMFSPITLSPLSLTRAPGAKLIYLPPYSPDFNPIEQSFHTIKAWLRRHEAEAVNPNVRPWLIHQASSSITPEMAQGWIENCGYEFVF